MTDPSSLFDLADRLCPSPPPGGGIVMLAFPSLLLNALSPEMARQQWLLVRQRFDHGSWKRLFWPVDVGSYGFSRASLSTNKCWSTRFSSTSKAPTLLVRMTSPSANGLTFWCKIPARR